MPVAGDIEWHSQRGVVELTCGDKAFARLWAAVGNAAGPAVAPVGAVDVVVLRRARPAPDAVAGSARAGGVRHGCASGLALVGRGRVHGLELGVVRPTAGPAAAVGGVAGEKVAKTLDFSVAGRRSVAYAGITTPI